MTIEQLKTHLAALREQALRIDGGIQTIEQLLQLAAQEAAKVAEVKD